MQEGYGHTETKGLGMKLSNFSATSARLIAAAALVVAACLAATGVQAKNNIGVDVLPFTLINDSGHPGKLFVYITGMSGSTWYHVTNRNGDVAAYTPSMTAQPFGLDLGKTRRTELKLPQLQAMRVYFSFRKPIRVGVSNASVPGVPAGWVREDPNFRTLFDWAEFTWVPDSQGRSTLGGNATQVDMFGFPMRIRLAGLDNDFKTPVVKVSGFGANNPRGKILDEIRRARRPWSRLIVAPGAKYPLRAIAPYNGMNLGIFPKNQLNAYINSVYSHYTRATLSARPEGVLFTGGTRQGKLVFQQQGDPNVSFRFPRPTGNEVYSGAILPRPMPSDPVVERRARAIGAQLQGAFMRSTLLINGNLDACRRGTFYKRAPVNHYARAIHAHAIRKLAYAFGFDDTCDQSSYIGVNNPMRLQIIIQPLD